MSWHRSRGLSIEVFVEVRSLSASEKLVLGLVQDVYGSHLTVRDVVYYERANLESEAWIVLPHVGINLSHWAKRRASEGLHISMIEQGISCH